MAIWIDVLSGDVKKGLWEYKPRSKALTIGLWNATVIKIADVVDIAVDNDTRQVFVTVTLSDGKVFKASLKPKHFDQLYTAFQTYGNSPQNIESHKPDIPMPKTYTTSNTVDLLNTKHDIPIPKTYSTSKADVPSSWNTDTNTSNTPNTTSPPKPDSVGTKGAGFMQYFGAFVFFVIVFVVISNDPPKPYTPNSASKDPDIGRDVMISSGSIACSSMNKFSTQLSMVNSGDYNLVSGCENVYSRQSGLLIAKGHPTAISRNKDGNLVYVPSSSWSFR
jgi:hypothetical protein